MAEIKKITFVFYLLVLSTTLKGQNMSDIDNVRHWTFRYANEWMAVENTVYGKFKEEYTEYFFFSPDSQIELDGKTYNYLWHYPIAFPMESRLRTEEVMHGDGMKARRYHSIGIRREDGRTYANREDFLYYQNYRYVHDFMSAWMFSFADSSYQPYHLTEDSSEVILYDYTMEVGDSYRHLDGYDDIVVVAKDTVAYLDGIARRRLTLSNGFVLVEGMGCLNSNGMLIDYLNPAAEFRGNYTFLMTCTDRSEEIVIYDYEQAGLHVADIGTLGISDHPATAAGKTESGPCYDLQGRRVNGPSRRGLYIRDGRKVMVVK